MKKAIALCFVLVLTAALVVGCGCRNSAPAATTVPTTAATTQPTTAPTAPSTTATEQTTMPTIEDGNGPLGTDETSDSTISPTSQTEDNGNTATPKG